MPGTMKVAHHDKDDLKYALDKAHELAGQVARGEDPLWKNTADMICIRLVEQERHGYIGPTVFF
jgi:hypothetical protein